MLGEKGEPGRFERRTRVAWFCGSSIFPAAAEVQPSERIPVPFISSHFYNQCKNSTQALSITAGLLMCSSGGKHQGASGLFLWYKISE